MAGAAATMQIAHVWPIVMRMQQSGWGTVAASVSLGLSALLAFGFALQLPRRLPALLAHRWSGGRAGDLGLSAAVMSLLLVLPVAIVESPSAAPVVGQASVEAGGPAVLASAGGDGQAVSPGGLERVEREIDPGSRPPRRLDGDAKAVAADPTDRDEQSAAAADGRFDFARDLVSIGDDEAGRSFAEGQLVDAISGAAWQLEVDAQPARAADGALGQGD